MSIPIQVTAAVLDAFKPARGRLPVIDNPAPVTSPPPELFQLGSFLFSNGERGDWKCECDALTPACWDWAAAQMSARYVFGHVVGVPSRRGLRDNAAELVKRLLPKHNRNSAVTLVVDDVYRTGGSLREERERLRTLRTEPTIYLGCTVFAREAIRDGWVNAIWKLW